MKTFEVNGMAEEKKHEVRFTYGEVPTQTEPVIVDNSKKEEDESRIINVTTALVKILNNQEQLKTLLK